MTEQPNLIPKRRFKEFQNTHVWEQRKLGDVIDGLYNGQTPSRFRDDFWNGNINWLSSGELNRSIVKTASEKITEAGQADANLRVVPKNTFVMAITGLEASGTRGNCGILGIDTTLNQSCMAVYPNKKLLSTRFLFQWYKIVGEDYGIRFTQGTKQQSYNAEIIKDLDICLPKVEEQLRISELLSEIDNLINLHRRKLEKTKALKSAYLSEMFPAEGEREPKRRFAGFTQSWEQRKMGELADIVRGASPRPIQNPKWFDDESDIGWLRISDVTEQAGRIHYLEQRISKAGQEKTRVLTEPHLLLSIAATVGKPVVNYVKTGVHDGFLIFLNPKFDREFMFQWLEMFRPKWQKYGQSGSQVNLNSDLVKNQEIMLPSEEEQKKMGEFFAQLDRQIALHQLKLEKLQNIKKAYLNEMFV